MFVVHNIRQPHRLHGPLDPQRWHQQTANPHNAIHAVCHLPCTVKIFGYDYNLGSLKRERTLHRYFEALGNALRDKSWSTCEINPDVMGRQSGWRHEPGSYKACPNEAVNSLKSEQVNYRHKGDMAGDATFVSSSENRCYSCNRTFKHHASLQSGRDRKPPWWFM